tara:strand:+ start:255 stop:680 length:426 start_codon:yes stop_codon:yes gene_type:complete
MKIGFYLKHNGTCEALESIVQEINRALSNNTIKDGLIFYEDAAKSKKYNCAMFNSCDLWSFSGKLITSSPTLFLKASNIVNNIDHYYYYGWEHVNALTLIEISNRTKIICNSEESAEEFYRLTNKRTNKVVREYKEITGVL